MTDRSLLYELIALARRTFPEDDYGFLMSEIYSRTLTTVEQDAFLRLTGLARKHQTQDSTFELIYHQLLSLYVLNGSRLEALRALDRRLRSLAAGPGTCLLISGVSGIGKTSLVLAFQERMRQLGCAFIQVRCLEHGNNAHGLWQEVARNAAAAGLSLDGLPIPLGPEPAAGSAQQLRQALADWLVRCAVQQPLVLLLDDLHWADSDSLEALQYLIGQSFPARVLLIVTYRSEELHSHSPWAAAMPVLRRYPQSEALHLVPLEYEDVQRVVRALQGAGSPELAGYLFKRAEGHPLFTVELLQHLASHKLLHTDGSGQWLPPEQSVPVPEFLRQLITQRINRLGNAVEQLLTIAAVAGEAWSLRIIEPIVGLSEPELLEALDQALAAGLIRVEADQAEIYRFTHGLLREVLYAQQLARRRKRTHARIAEQLETQQPNAVFAIAHHYWEAEQWPQAARACLAAGEQALQRFALHSGLQSYQQALSAVERAGNEPVPVSALMIYERLGRVYQALELRQEAELNYSRMQTVAHGLGDQVAEGRALVNLAHVHIRQYRFDLADQIAQEALKIAERAGDLSLLAQSHECLAVLYFYRGQLRQSRQHTQEALTRLQALNEPARMHEIIQLPGYGYDAIWSGQYPEAEQFSRSLIDHAREADDPRARLRAYQNLGWAQIETGQYREAYQNLTAVLEMDELSTGHFHNLPRLLNLLGYLHLELGGPQEALTWDQKALAASWLSQSQGNYEMRRYSLLNIATDYLQLGQLEAVQATIAQFEAITEAAESVRFRYFNRYQLLLSEFHLVQNLHTLAIELAQEARSLAEQSGMPKNIAKAHWFEGQALAGLRRFDEARDHLTVGILLADEIQHGSLRWKIRLSLASVLKMTGQSPAGVLIQARQLLDGIRRSLSGTPLEAVFLASPGLRQLETLESAPFPEKTTYPAGLTRREIEILRLVATGATNQQIADVLHISVRTVNTHMTNILNKTGCENRTAASAFAIQHNLLST